jgi:hypothetical protein
LICRQGQTDKPIATLERGNFFGELALPIDLANAVRLDNRLLDHCKKQHNRFVPRRELQRLGPVRDKEPLTLRRAADDNQAGFGFLGLLNLFVERVLVAGENGRLLSA